MNNFVRLITDFLFKIILITLISNYSNQIVISKIRNV